MQKNPLAPTAVEAQKRRRETLAAIFLGVFFLLLSWFEVHLFGISQELPFVHAVFFFGLVNFNIIILLLLAFFLFRNIVKAFVEKKGRIVGSSLKGKLVAAFLSFSLIPTLLMFLISVFYINSSFDKWFGVKISSVLRSSLEVTNEFYSTTKKRNYHYAAEIAENIRRGQEVEKLRDQLQKLQRDYKLDAIEFYDFESETRISVEASEAKNLNIPEADMAFLRKGAEQRAEASMIQSFGEGNLVRVVVPVGGSEERAALVVSTLIPLSLLSRMDDIAAAYEEFRDINPLEYPIKSIYLIILVMMTLVILVSASWAGVHLAKQLSVPLEVLGKATHDISENKFGKVEMVSGSEEINQLILKFNEMAFALEKSGKELLALNEDLDENNRYVEVVLSNVNTGVVAVDHVGNITKVNRYASQLLKIDSSHVIGKPAREVLSKEYYRIFIDLLRSMKKHEATSLQREFRLKVGGRSVPLQVGISLLKDDNGVDLGQVIVLDDLSMVVNAQRAAAWREVARRIAHEIKNPLTPIKLSAQRLQKKFGRSVEDPAFSSATSMIIDEVEGLKRLVNEFSNFARMPEIRPEFGDLNRLTNDVVDFYQMGQKKCRFAKVLDENLPKMEFDPEQMRRVLTNLIDNSVAAVAAQNNQRICVSTYYDPLLKLVQLKVIDNGPSISTEVMERLFEPYFSTKENGTGLGLAIVKRIVEDHNGFVRVNRLVPRGTEILLELPVVLEKAAWRDGPEHEEKLKDLT